jgi:hypothetical protein
MSIANFSNKYSETWLGAIQIIRDTLGGGGVQKKCHILFEWPLTTNSVITDFQL